MNTVEESCSSAMTSNRFHTIFFDMGGTVIRPSPSAGAVYADVAAKYGIVVDPAETDRRARELFGSNKSGERTDGKTPHTFSLDLARNYWRGSGEVPIAMRSSTCGFMSATYETSWRKIHGIPSTS